VSVRALARDFASEERAHDSLRAGGWPEWATMPLVYSTADGFFALVGRERCGGLETSPLRWHISLQGPGRIPTWDELVEAAHKLRPGVPFVIGVPPRSLWMNVHPHVLHLWETADAALLEEWRTNTRGDAPS